MQPARRIGPYCKFPPNTSLIFVAFPPSPPLHPGLMLLPRTFPISSMVSSLPSLPLPPILHLRGRLREAIPDLYGVLCVAPTATSAELGASYRRLLLCYHPDRQAGESDEVFGVRTCMWCVFLQRCVCVCVPCVPCRQQTRKPARKCQHMPRISI